MRSRFLLSSVLALGLIAALPQHAEASAPTHDAIGVLASHGADVSTDVAPASADHLDPHVSSVSSADHFLMSRSVALGEAREATHSDHRASEGVHRLSTDDALSSRLRRGERHGCRGRDGVCNGGSVAGAASPVTHIAEAEGSRAIASSSPGVERRQGLVMARMQGRCAFCRFAQTS